MSRPSVVDGSESVVKSAVNSEDMNASGAAKYSRRRCRNCCSSSVDAQDSQAAGAKSYVKWNFASGLRLDGESKCTKKCTR